MCKENMNKRSEAEGRNVRGQITVFVLIAIIVVSAILIFFLWVRPNYLSTAGENTGFGGCVEDAVEQSIEKLGVQGGFRNPEFTYSYEGQEIGYLCYTNLYYKACVVQKPFLVSHLENEIKQDVETQVEQCYASSINELNAQGYDVRAGNVDFNISLVPGQVLINLEAPTTITREGSQSFSRIRTDFNSPIYDLAILSNSILQFETRYGDSDVTSMMIIYPETAIDKIKRSDGTTVYILEDKNSGIKFQFASRSFAWPPGYGTGTGLVYNE